MDATTLVSEFTFMLHQLSGAFTRPTAETFRQLAMGWVLTPGVGTVTGMIRTLGRWATKHWTVYEKFFYRAPWSLSDLSRLLLVRLVAPLLGPTIDLNLDDTTCGPRGKHVALAGWYKDASAYARTTVIHWAHNWVIGAVSLRIERFPGLRLSLPVLFALHRKRSNSDAEHPYATLPELALGLLRQLAKFLPKHRIFVAVDGFYAVNSFLGGLPKNVIAVSRLRKNAALRELVPPDLPRRRGRPRLRGRRLPSLEVLTRQAKTWEEVELLKQGRTVRRRLHGLTCQWYHVCRCKPVRVVIVQDPSGREDDLHVVCTDPSVSDAEIVQRYIDRWGIEECIQEAKQQMGMERTRGFCKKTVSRQAPMAMILTTLTKLWFIKHGSAHPSLLPRRLPWYAHKRSYSFRDMLSALRQVFWRHRLLDNLHRQRQSNEFMDALTYALCEAA
ncbi:hypothetical protein LCGC14_1665250 [marine sediment metagenome]|uniref:Transposase IS701-like DDE domain-containing protein n=1 Tax=marine sediment metagenome TaxID=412755 RepID=A0A0F9HST0_9ZZZZ